MTRVLLLASLLAGGARASDPASVFSGVALSLGRGYRVTARLTFDRRKAAGGGFLFAAPRPSSADQEAIRMSEAVLTGHAGLFGSAGLLARRHRLAALALPQGRWESGGLVLRRPVFAPAAAGSGGSIEVVERFEDRRLAENEVVTLDAEQGLLIVHDSADQPFELDLSQALRAYDGLKDVQAVVQWYEGRRGDPAAAAFGARLIEELVARLAAGTAEAAEFGRVKAAVESGMSAEGRRKLEEAAARAGARQQRALLSQLEELSSGVEEAGSAQALARLEQESRRTVARAKAVAAVVGQPSQAKAAEAAAGRLSRRAQARSSSLGGRPGGAEAALAAAGAYRQAGVAVAGSFYERFVAQAGLAALIEDISADASLGLRRKAERLAALFSSAPLSGDSGLGREISELLPRAPSLAITGPDGGQPRVPSAEALSAIKGVWALSWSEGPLGRRKRAGAAFVPPALWVSAAEPSEGAGLAFSRDPVSGSRRRLLVEAEGDQYTLDRRTLAQAQPALIAETRRLSDAQLERAGRAARALDDELGYGVQLRFAFLGERLLALGWEPLR